MSEVFSSCLTALVTFLNREVPQAMQDETKLRLIGLCGTPSSGQSSFHNYLLSPTPAATAYSYRYGTTSSTSNKPSVNDLLRFAPLATAHYCGALHGLSLGSDHGHGADLSEGEGAAAGERTFSLGSQLKLGVVEVAEGWGAAGVERSVASMLPLFLCPGSLIVWFHRESISAPEEALEALYFLVSSARDLVAPHDASTTTSSSSTTTSTTFSGTTTAAGAGGSPTDGQTANLLQATVAAPVKTILSSPPALVLVSCLDGAPTSTTTAGTTRAAADLWRTLLSPTGTGPTTGSGGTLLRTFATEINSFFGEVQILEVPPTPAPPKNFSTLAADCLMSCVTGWGRTSVLAPSVEDTKAQLVLQQSTLAHSRDGTNYRSAGYGRRASSSSSRTEPGWSWVAGIDSALLNVAPQQSRGSSTPDDGDQKLSAVDELKMQFLKEDALESFKVKLMQLAHERRSQGLQGSPVDEQDAEQLTVQVAGSFFPKQADTSTPAAVKLAERLFRAAAGEMTASYLAEEQARHKEHLRGLQYHSIEKAALESIVHLQQIIEAKRSVGATEDETILPF